MKCIFVKYVDTLEIKEIERIKPDMKKMKLGICILVVLVLIALGAGCSYWYRNLHSETKQGGVLVYEHNRIYPGQQKC